LLDSKIEKLNYGTYMEEYQKPTLDVKMSPKESKAAILAIRFSHKGDFIAISYDNEHRPPETSNNSNINKAPTQGPKI